jgi:scyllo-inositol 2-dehydrogenase (NADP+)
MQPIKTALTSFGMSGKCFHAPFISLNEGFELYAAYERSKKESGETYPGVISYDRFESLLEDDNIELIVINTPNATHFDYAKRALLAGKHIVVEKPFCISTAECAELVQLAITKGKSIAVYQNRRWDSDYRTVKKVLDEKLLGKVVEAEFHYDRFDENLSPKLHKETPGPGAGILYDLGPHLIDQALQLFGMPDAVFADLLIMRPVSKVYDYFELLFFYNKMRVRLKSGYQVREALPAYIVHGRKGSFIKSRADVQEALLKQNTSPGLPGWGMEPPEEAGLLHTEIDGLVARKRITSETGNYGMFYDLLYRAIRNGEPVPVSAQEGRNVMAVIEACILSNATKKQVDL